MSWGSFVCYTLNSYKYNLSDANSNTGIIENWNTRIGIDSTKDPNEK